MNLTLLVILLVGFAIYFLIRDRLFFVEDEKPAVHDSFQAPAAIEILQPPTEAPQIVAASGPHAPSVAPPTEEVVRYAEPIATDPYHQSQGNSEHPENLRHPERAFRPPPANDMTQIAVQSGVASHQGGDTFQTEMIQGGGEFMPGIMANDSFQDTTYSMF